jgi:hypothetical protein
MIDVYNNHMHEREVPPEHAHGVVVDLKGTPDELDGQKFDVATVRALASPFHVGLRALPLAV